MANEPVVPSKKPWESKTVWVNAIVALAAFFPEVQAWIADNPQIFIFAFAAINFALRFITKDKVAIGE